MEPEVIALATAGATVIVEAIATDAWESTKESVRRFFGRSPDEVASIAAAEAAVAEGQEIVGPSEVRNDILLELRGERVNVEDLRSFVYKLIELQGHEGSGPGSSQIGAQYNYGTVNQQGTGVQVNTSSFDREPED